MEQEHTQTDEVDRQLQNWTRMLDDYQTQITTWKIQADKLKPEARASALGKIRRVEERIQAVRDRIAAVRASPREAQKTRAEAINEAKAGAGKAWDSVKTGAEEAWSELKDVFGQGPSKKR